MNKEQVPSGYVATCFNLKNVRDAICERKNAIMRLYLSGFVVITTLLLTKYFPYNHKDATNATVMNPKYNAIHISVCASLLYGRKFSDSTLCS